TEELRDAIDVEPLRDDQLEAWWREAARRERAHSRQRRMVVALGAAAGLAVAVTVTALVMRSSSPPVDMRTGNSLDGSTPGTSPNDGPRLTMHDQGLRGGFFVDLTALDTSQEHLQTPTVTIERMGPHGWYPLEHYYIVPPDKTTDDIRIC